LSSGLLKTSERARHTVISLLLAHKHRTESAVYVFHWYINVGKCPPQYVCHCFFSQHRRALTSSPLSDYFGLSSRVSADPVDVSLILEGNLMNELTPGADKD